MGVLLKKGGIGRGRRRVEGLGGRVVNTETLSRTSCGEVMRVRREEGSYALSMPVYGTEWRIPLVV